MPMDDIFDVFGDDDEVAQAQLEVEEITWLTP